MAINQIAKTGLSSLQVIYYFESLFICCGRLILVTVIKTGTARKIDYGNAHHA
ncbi:hypothetical protein XBO1_2030059 [Xenorhabdus bovienii str. oregonense]|uniref:Uncharacterized protein n=1 Tax=Xenorhabdus bovienii str. oregonense TaxID=1398202 RepID=A0A077P7V8_XENBV|nr:hypothetical protein XBO1_2030059 [Xenorhabdus bovienii str. oregonense]